VKENNTKTHGESEGKGYREYSKSPPDFGIPGVGWRKIVLRGVLRRGEVETDTPGGVDLS
jgi:hypothetical protein